MGLVQVEVFILIPGPSELPAEGVFVMFRKVFFPKFALRCKSAYPGNYNWPFMKIKVGIFFGGPSREREISFAGGRTVYDNLNKTLFEPVLIFVDSRRQFIQLDWHFVYKGSIRDFYPPVEFLPPSPHEFQIYHESLGELDRDAEDRLITSIGKRIDPAELPQLISIAFLALHGEYGEDGQIQRELEALSIPYTGSGIRASEIGMNKALQKDLMAQKGFPTPAVRVIDRENWVLMAEPAVLYRELAAEIGFPLVIRPANQGSSIGVSIIGKAEGLEGFVQSVNRAFFRDVLPSAEWQARSPFEREEYIRLIADIRDGLGFPVTAQTEQEEQVIYHPEALLEWLDDRLSEEDVTAVLTAHQSEQQVIVESFINGKEFSCIVIRKEDGTAVALPPTEIVKGQEVFDYRSKYLPGLSRKVTPIELPDSQINAIRKECEKLFVELGFGVYARIDGFMTGEQQIFLNDPNTTSGMLPSSFFFHQAAEIGLNPSQFLTYIIRISLQERLTEKPDPAVRLLLRNLDDSILGLQQVGAQKQKIAVILGGYSFERHISVESGRNIYEKLSSSDRYEPIPVFLSGNAKRMELYQLPINLLLKDNADDIRDKIRAWKAHPVVEAIKEQCAEITRKYASFGLVFAPQRMTLDDLGRRVEGVFVALHGRPGEDGQIQMELDARGIPYNGSGVHSSKITIDKYKTLQKLKEKGFPVAGQLLLKKEDCLEEEETALQKVEERFGYPVVGKPVDDGCSSAVKVIQNRKELEAFVHLMFREDETELLEADRKVLRLKLREEFPVKSEILFEDLITDNGAPLFMEITGGLLTFYDPEGRLQYQVFEPSEALAGGDVLSLEEKFLAGEGQNITPARFGREGMAYGKIADKVKADLERAARILEVEGYARIDAFVRVYANGKVETIIIEVNSLPGMTPATCIFHQAALIGLQPYDFIDRIIRFSFERKHRMAETGVGTTGLSHAFPPDTKEAEEKPVFVFEPVQPQQMSTDPGVTEYQRSKYQALFQESGIENPPAGFFAVLKTGILSGLSRFAQFIRSGFFLKNLGALMLMLLILILLVTLFLRLYTRHGESVQMDNYIGMKVEDAVKKGKNRGFKLVVIDSSVYEIDKEPGEIFDHDPKPRARVKENRTVYLSIYRKTPQEIRLSPFSDYAYDYENYKRYLESQKIYTAVEEEVFDSKQAQGTIMHFYYNKKKYADPDVNKGVRIKQGETLRFVITTSTSNFVPVPNLVCKPFEQASFLITSSQLAVGQIIGNVADQDNAYVWKQDPAYEPGAVLQKGAQITVYLTDSQPAGCEDE